MVSARFCLHLCWDLCEIGLFCHMVHTFSLCGHLQTDPQFIDLAFYTKSAQVFNLIPSRKHKTAVLGTHKANWPPQWETAFMITERPFGLKELKICWLWSYQEAVLSLSTDNTQALACTQLHQLTAHRKWRKRDEMSEESTLWRANSETTADPVHEQSYDLFFYL